MPGQAFLFEHLYSYPGALERHNLAPLYEERRAFLEKLQSDGRGIGRLMGVASVLLQLIRLLRLRNMRKVYVEELKEAARVWQTYRGPGRLGIPGKSATKGFMQVGREWLTFHGNLVLPQAKCTPYARHQQKYCEYLTVQVGLSPRTVQTHAHRLKLFFQWLSPRNTYLRTLGLTDLEEYFKHCATLGWKQITIAGTAHVLKSFLRFSERRRWSPPKISWGIVGPRFPRSHEPQKGPSWKGVCALLRSFRGGTRLAKRTKAMCLLLAKFGLQESTCSAFADERRTRQSLAGVYKSQTYMLVHSRFPNSDGSFRQGQQFCDVFADQQEDESTGYRFPHEIRGIARANGSIASEVLD